MSVHRTADGIELLGRGIHVGGGHKLHVRDSLSGHVAEVEAASEDPQLGYDDL